MLPWEAVSPATRQQVEINFFTPSASSWISSCPQPHTSLTLVLLPCVFLLLQLLDILMLSQRTELNIFAGIFAHPPCLMCSTCVHGNNFYLPLQCKTNLVWLQFIFFTAVRPINIFFKKNEFKIQNTFLAHGKRLNLNDCHVLKCKMNYCSDLHISWVA